MPRGDLDRVLVEPQRLAALVGQHRDPEVRATSRSDPGRSLASQHEGGAEGDGQRQRAVVVGDADLRHVGAVVGGRVQVDADVAADDHLVGDQPGDARGHRALVRPGEGAVEVATVGRYREPNCTPEDVDDRHHDDGTRASPDRARRAGCGRWRCR
jgi:hypothetical protein